MNWPYSADPDIKRISFCVDRGGTFTDCIAHVETSTRGTKILEYKLLSEDPQNYTDAPREGIRRILERTTGISHPKDKPLDTSRIAGIRMATTVATNALLERKGEKFALLITKGFRDLLHIGTQARPRLFDLAIVTPEVLYEEVIEIDERVICVGYSAGGPKTMFPELVSASDTIKSSTGEYLRVTKQLDLAKVREQLAGLLQRGIQHVAVTFMHSFMYNKHELTVAQLATEMGFKSVTCSSVLLPMVKIVSRGSSACVDSYLTPCIQRYLQSFARGFDANFSKLTVLFMQSDGGLVPLGSFSGFKAILSGPAGGVVGYAKTAFDQRVQVPVIGFDMGGTSTDVSRYAGSFEHVLETTTAGIPIQVPQLDINTVAAGGGSRLFFRNGMLAVGPESAGAHPGPSCYRKGGPLTITDANVVLGRVVPEMFPKIFGETESEGLDVEASRRNFATLLDSIKGVAGNVPDIVDELAFGFVQVANEAMCRPIRELTQAKGFDTSKHVLACFGGAGGQHACAIARILGLSSVFIHRHASVLSAYGLALADVVFELQEPCFGVYQEHSAEKFVRILSALEAKCLAEMKSCGYDKDAVTFEYFLNSRYDGTDCSTMVRSLSKSVDFKVLFEQGHQREFGFVLNNRDVVVDDVRVRAIGNLAGPAEAHDDEDPALVELSADAFIMQGSVFFAGGRRNTPVYRIANLTPGNRIQGPAILSDSNNTILVEPDTRAVVTSKGNIVIKLDLEQSRSVGIDLDPVQLSIFAHRFMSIAEQMGRTLQRTAVSTNIKERLDFSCAIFGSDSGLVANAPHIPVHLGSMQETVKCQMDLNRGNINEGDVFVTNHPSAGGSHLPDITVITPVFNKGRIVFFVASRGHHADIGGISPGSMPPDSKFLFQEGAAIISLKLVTGGLFQEAAIRKALLQDPSAYPGCSGTRNLKDNLSDLKAQVAANHRGICLVQDLIQEYGEDVVLAYMIFIQENAEAAVRNVLKKTSLKFSKVLEAEDFMDDGSRIKLRITIDPEDGGAVFDFSGTSPQVYGNLNAPPSVVYSAIIYCLRCLVKEDIPLNQGCLRPVKVILKQGSILSPETGYAVVGGNVLTSQRLVDVILKAFNACAASQGCMNNLTFGMAPDAQLGREGWGYYETVCGGAGAGESWTGRSGVHTHMTNTKITDPEILERRYPVILHRFGLRSGSGGAGKHRGGDGVVRELEFVEPLQVSILSERRVHAPYGLAGGENGKTGINLLQRGASIMNLGGKCTIRVEAGDCLKLLTPGGGGYGQGPLVHELQECEYYQSSPL